MTHLTFDQLKRLAKENLTLCLKYLHQFDYFEILKRGELLDALKNCIDVANDELVNLQDKERSQDTMGIAHAIADACCQECSTDYILYSEGPLCECVEQVKIIVFNTYKDFEELLKYFEIENEEDWEDAYYRSVATNLLYDKD